MQSATKTLTSSGFGVCGAVIARKNLTTNIDNDALKSDFASYVKYLPNRDYGPNLHPMQAIMALNDMRTLRSKVDLMSRNTMRVAQFLEEHPAVESVQYLGLPNHPLHELASRYLWLVDAEHDELYGKPVNRYGHLLSFCVRGGEQAARTMFDKLQRIWRATDLGRIKSVATIPAISTHQQQGEEGPRAGAHPAEHGPPLRRRRTPRRRHRRPRSGTRERGPLRAGESISVAFRSAKVADFRGAKGDYPTVIDSPALSLSCEFSRSRRDHFSSV